MSSFFTRFLPKLLSCLLCNLRILLRFRSQSGMSELRGEFVFRHFEDPLWETILLILLLNELCPLWTSHAMSVPWCFRLFQILILFPFFLQCSLTPFLQNFCQLVGSFSSLSSNQPLFPWLFGGMGSEPGSSSGCYVCQAVFSLSPESQLKSKDND